MKTIISTFMVILMCLNLSKAQSLLNSPEHVVYDEINQQYLVTNYGNGKIIAINSSGEEQVIIEGVTGCLGIHIVDTTIFITAGKNLYAYGLTSHELIQSVTLTVPNWVDGMIDDGNGNLYLAENSGKVVKVDLSDFSETIIVNSGLPQYPQDLAYDPIENRLILVGWQWHGSVVSIDLDNNEVTELIETTAGQYDGIVRDSAGNLFVTSWLNNGRVYKWEYPYTSDPQIYSEGHAGPAGLAINKPDNLLAVPNFNGDSLSYIALPLITSIIEMDQKPPFTITNNIITIKNTAFSEIIISDITGRNVFRETVTRPEMCYDLNSILINDRSGIFIISLKSKNGIYSTKIFHN